jgi:hypothetical protein
MSYRQKTIDGGFRYSYRCSTDGDVHPSNSRESNIMTFDPTMGGDDMQPTQGDETAAPEEQKEKGADDMAGGEEMPAA